MKNLDRSFYEQNTVDVAKQLLGKLLVHRFDGKMLTGYITETEAYQSDDPACHAYNNKKTKRTKGLFGPVGHVYVYKSYGLHVCMNIVARSTSQTAGGVLIRALQPAHGIEHMIKARNNRPNIATGPGNVTQALGVTMDHYGCNVMEGDTLSIEVGIVIPESSIKATPRIGISQGKDLLWRFVVQQK